MKKVIRVIMRPIQKRFFLMQTSLKKAKKRVFMGLKRLNKVFSRKEGKLSVHVLCISYEQNMNEISSMAK